MFEECLIDWDTISNNVCQQYKTSWGVLCNDWVNPEKPESHQLEQLIIDTVDAVRDRQHKKTLKAVADGLELIDMNTTNLVSYCNQIQEFTAELRKAAEE